MRISMKISILQIPTETSNYGLYECNQNHKIPLNFSVEFTDEFNFSENYGTQF